MNGTSMNATQKLVDHKYNTTTRIYMMVFAREVILCRAADISGHY
jgi:site-specific recombinase XerD